MGLVGTMVQDICYNNARSYFGFEGLPAPRPRGEDEVATGRRMTDDR